MHILFLFRTVWCYWNHNSKCIFILKCYCFPKTTGSWSGDSKSYWGHQSLCPPFPWPKQELELSATWELAIMAYHTSVGTCGHSAAKIKFLYCSRSLLEVCNVHFYQVPSDDDLLQYEWRLMGCVEGYRVAISHITGKEFSLDTPHVAWLNSCWKSWNLSIVIFVLQLKAGGLHWRVRSKTTSMPVLQM